MYHTVRSHHNNPVHTPKFVEIRVFIPSHYLPTHRMQFDVENFFERMQTVLDWLHEIPTLLHEGDYQTQRSGLLINVSDANIQRVYEVEH